MFNKELVYKDKQILKSIIEDVEEINNCFKCGAYKASLILSGSVLEVFLIDWLSEMKHKDFFNHPYYIKVRNNNGTFSKKMQRYVTILMK